MRKVLVVADLSHASPRIPGLAKYLPDFGWKPIVLTGSSPEDTFGREFEFVQTPFPNAFTQWKRRLHLDPNAGFQKQLGIPFSIRQSRTSVTSGLVNIGKLLIAYPDQHRGWKRFAVETANRLIETEHVDAVISSSSPVTSHVIASELKHEYGIPWAADLRDLWSQNHNYHYGRLRQVLDRRLELKVLRKADALVTVSPVWAKQLGTLHGRDFVYSIPNGFDPDQVKGKDTDLTPEFTITYTGSIYEGKQDVESLLAAVNDLISDGTMSPEDVRIRFYGPPSEAVNRKVRDYGMTAVVKQYGSVSRASAFERQRESQVLLVFYWNDSRIKGWYPSKVFEYLAAQRPILVTGGAGDDVVEALLDETGAGVYCTTEGEIRARLREMYMEFKRNGKTAYTGDMERCNRYSYREMARAFAGLLDSVV